MPIEALSAFPPWAQLIVIGVAAVVLGIGVGLFYVRQLKAPIAASAKSPIDMTALGVAFANDRAQQEMAEAVKDISHTLKDIRAIYDRSTERDIDWRRDMLDALNAVAAAKRGRG